MARKIVPDLVSNQKLATLTPADSAAEAARMMDQRNIGAVLIVEGATLVGICTERDITRRIVAKGQDAASTPLAKIMTAHPATVAPDETPRHALEMMSRIGCRHLPVLEGERIVGILSIRDLYAAIHDELQEDLKLHNELFMGSGYSVSN